MDQYEREEEELHDSYACGEINEETFNREMRELQRAYRATAQEAAERAYDDELERW
jgi:hypothetical protein